MQALKPQLNGNKSPSRECNTSWVGLLDPKRKDSQSKVLEVSTSIIGNINFVKKYFIDLNKEMMETKYTSNLGQQLKITSYLKKYLLQKLKPIKPSIPMLVLKKTHVHVIVVDPHMVII